MPGLVSFHTFMRGTAIFPLLYLFLILACVMGTAGYHGGGAARWTTLVFDMKESYVLHINVLMIAVVVQISESLSQEKAPVVDIDGMDAPGEVEVIDLDDYVFRFCTCSVELVTNPSLPPRVVLASPRVVLAYTPVVLALPAVSSRKCRIEVEVESPAPPDAVENPMREALRHYTTRRYYWLCKAQLTLQALAQVNLRQSSCLQASK